MLILSVLPEICLIFPTLRFCSHFPISSLLSGKRPKLFPHRRYSTTVNLSTQIPACYIYGPRVQSEWGPQTWKLILQHNECSLDGWQTRWANLFYRSQMMELLPWKYPWIQKQQNLNQGPRIVNTNRLIRTLLRDMWVFRAGNYDSKSVATLIDGASSIKYLLSVSSHVFNVHQILITSRHSPLSQWEPL